MTDQNFTFKRAQRVQARLRLAMSGVSGAGKTMGALRVAKGIVQALIDTGQIQGPIEGKIAVIDTERKSASLYAHVVPFDALELDPPYTVDRYQQAIAAAEHAGYVVCIIDQGSHAWAGPGGQLEWIDTLKASAKNAISPWAKVTPVQQEFYDRMLRSPMHIIFTMRAKSEWVIEDQVDQGGRTKKVPRKIGLSPVQREGIEYEFTTCLDIDLDSHMATASKDRTGLFMDRQTKLDEECGRRLAEWLVSGVAPAPEAPTTTGSSSQAGGERAEILKKLEDGVADYELGFLECPTLPDLAAHFDKAQKFVRSFVKDLGADAVKPYMDRVVASKDKRKSAISLQLTTKPADPEATTPGGTDLLGDPEKLSIADVTRLANFAVNEGLDDKETLECLGVQSLNELPKSGYAEATEKILKAAREKKGLAKPKRERAKAAA